MTAPSDDLDGLQFDIGNLHHLLEVLYEQTAEQEFMRDGKRIALADQIHALASIARDLAERLNETAGACIDKALADARAGKAAA
ncbi:MAG: hypothetical protein EOS07_24630 [Mesorhizobium sp.]|nr:MAG: hypothetical protein EOS07_24630 [Mesorhizobium sp.]